MKLYLLLMTSLLANCATNTSSSKQITLKNSVESKVKNLLSSAPSQLRASPDETEILFLMKDPQEISQEQLFTYNLESKRITRKTYLFGRVILAEYKNNQEIVLLSNTDLIKEKPVYLYPNLNQLNSGDVYLLSEKSKIRLSRLTKTGVEKSLGKFSSPPQFSTEIFKNETGTYLKVADLKKQCLALIQKVPSDTIESVYLPQSQKVALTNGFNFELKEVSKEVQPADLEKNLKACE